MQSDHRLNESTGRFDPVTKLLHGLLALGIIVQLSLASVMHVPPGPGQGVFDWHREAFEIHARSGLAVALICVLHWMWILLPFSTPGSAYLFPWATRAGREALSLDLQQAFRRGAGRRERPNCAIGTIQGLGFLAISVNAVSGLVNYAGYFVGVPVPRSVLHAMAVTHRANGYVIAAFLIGHVAASLAHWLNGDRQIWSIFRPRTAPKARPQDTNIPERLIG